MSRWNIAAAQYVHQHPHVDDHIAHHLRFIDNAARQQCDLLVFPELSLTGPGDTDLPAPPDDRQLAPLLKASRLYNITVIAGLTLEKASQRQKGLVMFTPRCASPLRYPQGTGASVVPGSRQLAIIDAQSECPELDPHATLVASSQAVGDNRWRLAMSSLQRFAHRYGIAVLMANARGGSTLWDEKGQLIVSAGNGELLLTGSRDRQGWQGDIIPLG